MDIAARYHAEIERIVALAPGPDKFIHVQAGLIIWLTAAVAMRRPLASPLPIAIVCLCEAGNEVMDRLYAGSWQWHGTMLDVLATLAWPVILALALRLDRRLGRL